MRTKTTSRTTTIRQRIRLLYELCNRKHFARCIRMVDPAIRQDSASVTRFQYEQSLAAFMSCFKRITVRKMHLTLHCGEPSALYGKRDFAVGTTTWEDPDGNRYVFQERWVRQGRSWYTRSTGFASPAADQ